MTEKDGMTGGDGRSWWVDAGNGVIKDFLTAESAHEYAAACTEAGLSPSVEEWVPPNYKPPTKQEIRAMRAGEAKKQKAAEKERKRRRREEAKQRLKFMRATKALRGVGVLLSVDGCGCCGSPVVTLTVGGVRLLDAEDDAVLDMHRP